MGRNERVGAGEGESSSSGVPVTDQSMEVQMSFVR